jgi:hypothetical protein
MPLRDRVQSAITGFPSSTDSQPSRAPNNSRALQGPRGRQSRADPPTSMTNISRRASQLAIEGNSTSSPNSRFRPQKLAIEGSSTLTPTRASGQNRLTGPTTNPASARALTESNAGTSPLPLARTSRPYGSSSNQEAFALDPSRRLGIGNSRRATYGGSTAPPKVANHTNYVTEPGAKRTTGDDLAPLSQREIIDVTDEDILPARANTRGHVGDGPQRTQFQRPACAPNAPAPGSMPQRNQPPTRMPSAARFNNQDEGYSIPEQAHRDIRETVSQLDPSLQPPNRPPESRSEPVPTTHASGEPAEKPQELYLGVFDLEETDQPAQQPTPNLRGGPSQRGNGNRSRTFSSSSASSHTSTSSHSSTVINHGFRVGQPFWRPSFPPPICSYGYGCERCGRWDCPLGGLPWLPRPYVVLPRQTVFTEVSVDYFEQESPATPNFDASTGIEVINRYYNGWRDAYTQALSYSEDISATDRARIKRNSQRLQSRQEEAIRRLRSGDQVVVQETLDQVRMDRQMAIDMPVTQIRWTTPWIREVWVTEHGEIPY